MGCLWGVSLAVAGRACITDGAKVGHAAATPAPRCSLGGAALVRDFGGAGAGEQGQLGSSLWSGGRAAGELFPGHSRQVSP